MSDRRSFLQALVALWAGASGTAWPQHRAPDGSRIALVMCTSAKTPFLARHCVSPGTFIAAVGADNPHKSEIHPELMQAARVVTDLTSQAEVMGDLHHAIGAGVMTAGEVHAELGEIVAGRKPGRGSATEITIFDSTGVGIQDVAAAAWAYERAMAAKEIENA